MNLKRCVLTSAVTGAFAFASVLAGAPALAASAPAAAKGSAKQKNLAPDKGTTSPTALAVGSVATAHALVRYGDANKDPLALISAARILKEVGSSASRAQAESPTSEAPKSEVDKFSVDAVLARARALSQGRADLLALADDVAKSGSRGRSLGPSSHRDLVRNRATDVYSIMFDGGEPARILVSGDGDSDLDLYVYDEYGNLVCEDEDPSDDMVCGWRPRYTGKFRIKIVNRGVANQYVMVTN